MRILKTILAVVAITVTVSKGVSGDEKSATMLKEGDTVVATQTRESPGGRVGSFRRIPSSSVFRGEFYIVEKVTTDSSATWVQLEGVPFRKKSDVFVRLGPEAIEYFTTQIQADSTDSSSYNCRGLVNLKLGMDQEARHDFERAVRLDGNESTYVFNLAIALGNLKLFDQAKDTYTDYLTRFGDDAEVFEKRGFTYLDLGQRENALKDFQSAVEIDPSPSGRWYDLGKAYQELGQHSKAVECFSTALTRDWDYKNALDARAYSWESLGEFEKAKVDYLQVLDIDPADASGYNNFAWMLATCEDQAVRDAVAAVEHAKKAASLTRNEDFNILNTLAVAYASKGDFEEATAIQEDAIAKAPADQQDVQREFIEAFRNKKILPR